MRYLRQCVHFMTITGAIVLFTGCAYQTALQQLSPEEQTVFRAHHKIMTWGQAHTYLSKATAAERAAYLKEIGTAQRFQALPPEDRQAILAGFIRKGMRADALRFLWGEPFYTKGRTGHYEDWYYLGSSWSLTDSGNATSEAGTMVIVSLIDGQVDGWMETTPTDFDTGGEGDLLP